MITLSDTQARKLVSNWQDLAYNRKVERANLNEYQRGAADAYEAAARDLREVLKKNEDDYNKEQDEQALKRQGRNATFTILVTVIGTILVFLCSFPLFIQISFQYNIALLIIYSIFLAFSALTRWRANKSFDVQFVFILAGSILVGLNYLGSSLQAGIMEVTSTIGGQVMGAALAGGLILWMRKRKSADDMLMICAVGMLGLLTIFYSSGLPFFSTMAGLPRTLGFELLGAGITVLVIGGWIEE